MTLSKEDRELLATAVIHGTDNISKGSLRRLLFDLGRMDEELAQAQKERNLLMVEYDKLKAELYEAVVDCARLQDLVKARDAEFEQKGKEDGAVAWDRHGEPMAWKDEED